MSRGSNLFMAGVLVFAMALAPALVEAKAGSGSSMGSRGSRTYQPNAARPIERSITPPPAIAPSAPLVAPTPAPRLDAPAMASPRPSFFQRHPFVSGLMGGFIGAGLGSMLFGGHFFGGGIGGIFSLLLQIALIVFLVKMAIAFFRRGSGPVLSGAVPSGADPMAMRPGSGASQPNPVAFSLGEGDLAQIEQLLVEIQAAWSRDDVAALAMLTSPEISGYMEEQLRANQQRGVTNRVEQVRLVKGDVNETWREGPFDYATVTLRWSAIDYVQKLATGELVEGNAQSPRETTEVWTVVRRAGEVWRLSAIQQV